VTSATEVTPAVALARVLAESADRWDPALLGAHVALLERLCLQAPAHALRVGHDMAQLAALIAAL